MSASTILTIASFHCGTGTNAVAEEVWSIEQLLQTDRGLNDQEKQGKNKLLAHILTVTVVNNTGSVLESHFDIPSTRYLSLVFGEGFSFKLG